MSKVVVFFLILELLARETEHGGNVQHPTELMFFYKGQLIVLLS